jgi:hypothetical protein
MMPKGKKHERLKQRNEGANISKLDELSSECKEVLVGLLERFYEHESSMSLERKYIQYGEEGITKFKIEMTQRMMNALHNP